MCVCRRRTSELQIKCRNRVAHVIDSIPSNILEMTIAVNEGVKQATTNAQLAYLVVH